MYVAIAGSKNNKEIYIKQSYRKENGYKQCIILLEKETIAHKRLTKN